MTLLTCGNDLLTCGNDLLTCGNNFLTCGNDLLTCGNKIKKCKENSSMSLPGLRIFPLATHLPRIDTSNKGTGIAYDDLRLLMLHSFQCRKVMNTLSDTVLYIFNCIFYGELYQFNIY